MKRRITEVWPLVLKVAWPLIVANSFWNIQLTIDRVFLGQYSTESLGAAMAVFGVFWAPMALVQQTTAYVSTFVAQYLGAGQPDRIARAFWQAMLVAIIGGLLFLGLIPLAGPLFTLMDHSSSIMHLETEYFSALAFSALPTAVVAACGGYYTGLGRTAIIMWMNGIGMLGNIFFDYLLIFGNWGLPEMGIAGAGYATALAGVLSALLGLGLIWFKDHRLHGIRENIGLEWGLLKRFLKFGIPSGLQFALEGLAFTVFLLYVGRMPNGDAALAASGIAVTIMLIALLPPLGVGQAVAVLVGQRLGANQARAAERVSYIGLEISLCFMVLVGSSFYLFPQFYLSWFAGHGQPELWAEVSQLVPHLLMFVCAFILFDSFNLVFSFALRGAGDTRFVTAVALTIPWPIMVLPTALIYHRSDAIYWGWGFASSFIILQGLVFWWRFNGGAWKSMRVIETDPAQN